MTAPSPLTEPVTSLRRTMLASCAALIVVLWTLALASPSVPTSLDFGLVQGWATFGLLTSALSRRPRHRRLHFTLALLLLASTWALPAWHLRMPQAAYIAADSPPKADLAALQAIWGDEADALVRFAWVPGLWRACWPAFVWVMPISTVVLLLHALHPLSPAWSRHVAKAGVAVWLLAAFAGMGTWLSTVVAGSPTWFWVLLVIGLPFQLKSGRIGVVLALWGLCVAALVARLASLVVSPGWLCDESLALAILLTLACSVAWYARMEAITVFDLELQMRRASMPPEPPPAAPAPPATFDLIEHLDSPQAQEGADKYSRE